MSVRTTNKDIPLVIAGCVEKDREDCCEGCSDGAEVGDADGGSKGIIVSLSTFNPHVAIPLGIPGLGCDASDTQNVPRCTSSATRQSSEGHKILPSSFPC